MSDTDLVQRAVGSAMPTHSHEPIPRWSYVGSLFGLGSASAIALCRRFGLDPDEQPLIGETDEGGECGASASA